MNTSDRLREEINRTPWIHESGVEARAKSLATINAIADAVYRHLDLATLVEQAVEVLAEYIPVKSVALFTLNDADSYLNIVAWRGFSEATLKVGSRLPVTGSLTGFTVTCCDIVTTYDLAHNEQLEPRVKQALLEEGVTGCISFPLLFKGQAIGAANLIFEDTHILTPLERETLLAIGKTIGLAMMNARHVSQIEAEIHERRQVEAELVRHREHLEELVNARTSELEDANAQLRELIAERDTALKKLAAAQQHAEQMSEAKTVFLSNMSHELRTPLNVIIGYASSMLNNSAIYEGHTLPDIYRKDIQIVLDNTNYLLRLITDILDLSKIEAGKLELRLAGVDLADILNDVLTSSTPLLRDKPIELRSQLADALPLAWADPLRVRQIVLNLMSNAIKFTKAGHITLSAEVEQNNIRVSITDTGIGIPTQRLSTLFERFHQDDSDLHRRYGGTGLGLNISQQLTRMQGGQMSVTSILGEGSVFSFTLPIAQNQSRPAAAPARGAVSIFQVPEPAESPFILLMAERSAQDALRQLLEQRGYQVLLAEHAQHAYEMVVSLAPDLIVLWQVKDSDWLLKMRHSAESQHIPVLVGVEDADQFVRDIAHRVR
ncbi:MAG: GAF domain-containing protein [Anaerolineae bacterium]|nr:GAF domain-containing protein [Anaerolineae bacterium]